MPEYVVITRTPSLSPALQKRSADRIDSPFEPNEISSEKMDLPESEEANLARDPRVVDFARNMPTELIRPRAASQDTSTGDIWGIEAVGASTTRFTGMGATVAVLDTGIDKTHPAFAKTTVIGKDFSGAGDGDVDGHGTHCAGTIFGCDVAGQRIGIARGVETALIGKVLRNDGYGDTDMIIKGIMWAVDQGANIISMSLGFDFPGMVRKLVEKEDWPADMATTIALQAFRTNMRLLDTAMRYVEAQADFGKHSIIIAASGNESRREDNAQYRIAASPPSAAEGVIAVGAVSMKDTKFEIAPFSNSHPLVCAPGVGISSAKVGGGLVSLSGTSMACPHAAGIAALWWQQMAETGGPAPNRLNVSANLISSVDRSSLVDYNETDFGNGLVKAP